MAQINKFEKQKSTSEMKIGQAYDAKLSSVGESKVDKVETRVIQI